MKKILFLSHIDWKWIKQRPQFLAEEFSKYFELVCISPYWYNRKKLQTRNFETNSIKKFYNFYGLPKGKNSLLVRKLNYFFRSIFTFIICLLEKPEYIYIPSPDLYCNWMKMFFKGKVIYDCMDDYCALSPTKAIASYMEKKEQTVLQNVDEIITSSANLKNNLIQKYKHKRNNISIVRNGYSGKILDLNIQQEQTKKSSEIHIGYIGTISSWFDIIRIKELIRNYPNVIIHIIGPIQSDSPTMDGNNIILEGIVEHDELYEKIKNYDCLIMPFIVNEIVESVDPVKLYEYINFAKPIISVLYGEIERFEPYVWFYDNDEINICTAFENFLLNGIKYNNDQRIKILKESNWKNRAEEFRKVLID